MKLNQQDMLEATLWTLLTTKSYNQTIIKAINLGEVQVLYVYV